MTVRLVLRAEPEQRLDLSALTPDRLAGLDRAAIERIALHTTRAPVLVGDVFRLRMGDPGSVVFEGGSARFDRVGAAMTRGEITVDGDAGAQLGRRMTGGRILVHGDAGPHAASGLAGGMIEIGGDAGDFLGGPLAGEVAGMAGGTVVVRGHAGARAGDRLRRGIIVVERDAGAAAGSRMIAGTLVVCGTAGALPGYLLRRGTLVFGAADLPPTFVPVGTAGPGFVFARLLARALEPVSRRAARLVLRATARHMGDMAALGRGEALLPPG